MLDIIKQLCFFGTLAIASSIDVKRKTVPTVILLSLFLTGWINISLQSVAGFFCALIPVGITGILRQDLGGGDVKLSALCGWVMGIMVLPSLIIGMLIAVFVSPIIWKQKGKREVIPLVPYISIGCFATTIVYHFILL